MTPVRFFGFLTGAVLTMGMTAGAYAVLPDFVKGQSVADAKVAGPALVATKAAPAPVKAEKKATKAVAPVDLNARKTVR
jgi:hypothetical protein